MSAGCERSSMGPRPRQPRGPQGQVIPIGTSHGFWENPVDDDIPFVVIHASTDGRNVEWIISVADALLLADGLVNEIQASVTCPDYTERRQR